MRTAFATLAALVLLVLTGCGGPRLDAKSTVEVNPGESKLSFVDAIKSDQKINVTAKSGAEFDIYLFLEKNQKSVEKEVDAGKFAGVLDKAVKTTDAKLSATIPAGETGTVMIRSSKKASVNLHIKNF